MKSDTQCITTIKQHDSGDESNSCFLRQTNLIILNNQLQPPRTQHKETKAQSTTVY